MTPAFSSPVSCDFVKWAVTGLVDCDWCIVVFVYEFAARLLATQTITNGRKSGQRMLARTLTSVRLSVTKYCHSGRSV